MILEHQILLKSQNLKNYKIGERDVLKKFLEHDLKISKILKIKNSVCKFSKTERSKTRKMDQSLAESRFNVAKLFDLELNDNLKPDGENKKRFPKAGNKLGR